MSSSSDTSGLEVAYPIPKPSRWPALVYANPDVSATLQVQMRLEDDIEKFTDVVTLIRHTAAQYVNLHVPYRDHSTDALKRIKGEVLKKSAVLRNEYVNGWPIMSYLKIALKSHTATRRAGDANGKRRPGKRANLKASTRDHAYSYPYPKTWSDKKSTSFIMRKHPQPSSRSVEADLSMDVDSSDIEFVSSGFEEPCNLFKARTARNGAHGYPSIPNRPEPADSGNPDARRSRPWCRKRAQRQFSIAAAEASGQERDNLRDQHVSDTSGGAASGLLRISSAEQPSATSAASVCNDNLRSLFASAPQPHPSSRQPESPALSDSPSDSRPRPTGAPISRPASLASTAPIPAPPESQPSLRDMLAAQSLPSADVSRIAALFAAFGAGEGAYLRVFARMAARDAWLRELRERGELSEMQYYVVRAVFERIAGPGNE